MAEYQPLVEAIKEVGNWRWWSRQDDIVQLEFSGVTLALDADGGVPTPINPVALRFGGAGNFGFLTRTTAEDLPDDWPTRMANDTLDFAAINTGLSYELLAINDSEALASVLTVPHRANVVIGSPPRRGTWLDHPVVCAFWAGNVGAYVTAESLRLQTRTGSVALEDVARLTNAWWKYWRIYWDRRATTEALPYDGSCEVTIPMKGPPQA
ncbi:MAG TPA: hypothetical protein VF193_06005 [Steroidobacter sp.]|jgi:hypothetical protein